jgi:hypothetical protein
MPQFGGDDRLTRSPFERGKGTRFRRYRPVSHNR